MRRLGKRSCNHFAETRAVCACPVETTPEECTFTNIDTYLSEVTVTDRTNSGSSKTTTGAVVVAHAQVVVVVVVYQTLR